MEDIILAEIDADIFPVLPTLNTKTNNVVYMVINQEDLLITYTDLTE